MAVDESIYKNIYDIGDLSLFDDQYFDTGFYKKSELCVPDDPIESIPLFPDFCDGLISMNDSCLLEDFEKNWCLEDKQGNSLNDCDYGNEPINIAKKQRSKRMWKQQHAWSLKDFLVHENKNLPDKDISLENQPPRKKCTHCQTDSTPQWRMGPLGPRTLCNACGVRYKSGRLLPEYRPVASPTFDEGKHSNFHKKVLKKRAAIE